MPTHSEADTFWRDWRKLSPEHRAAFYRAWPAFAEDLPGRRFRKALRVKGFRGSDSIFELSFAPDGRALWMYGDPVQPGEPHIIWLRIGTHDIFRDA